MFHKSIFSRNNATAMPRTALRTGLLATVLVAVMPQLALACPMCAETVSADAHLPKAFMWSILFMLAMPAVVLGGFGFAVFRVIRQRDAGRNADLELESTSPISSSDVPATSSLDGIQGDASAATV